MAATEHYAYYPKGDFPPYLAYGFRPAFLLMAPYMILSILLWALHYTGVIPLPFIGDALSWHIYEMLYGVGFLGMAAFILTGAPELYPGTVPIVGETLRRLFGLWILGRAAFWLSGWISLYPAALINIALFAWLTLLVIKPIFKDPAKRHVSIAYGFIAVQIAQIWFYLAAAGWVGTPPLEVLKVALGIFLVLIVLSIRRVNTEAVNEILEHEGYEEVFFARPPAYNLTIFMIALFTTVEFFWPQNRAIGWIALGTAAASLAILNDFIAYDETNLFKKRLILSLMLIPLSMAAGYGLIGYNYLAGLPWYNGDLLHMLTSGTWTLSFYLVMMVITIVHTGRDIAKERDIWICLSVGLILLSAILRTAVAFYPAQGSLLILLSAIIWALPFILYIKRYSKWLLSPRADGIPE
jgi:uncharacterized protein involved in response to NO